MKDLAIIFVAMAIVIMGVEPASPMLRAVSMILAMAAILAVTVYPVYF